jgi:hypothetical protein
VDINPRYREDGFMRCGSAESRLEVERGEWIVYTTRLFQINGWQALLCLFLRCQLIRSSQMEVWEIFNIIIFFLVNNIARLEGRWDGKATSRVF